MVYGLFYLPTTFHHTLLTQTYKFNDSKLLTPTFRSHLMQQICSPETPLYTHCGWAIRSLSAQDISSGMLRPTHTPFTTTGSSGAGTPQISNLNNQAIEATITLIHEILYDLKINIQHIYIDTIGKPEIYQARLEKIFPAVKITVAKKADSLFPCVSAASVCAKVTRDAALEVLYGGFAEGEDHDDDAAEVKTTTTTMAWGSGYPSDVRCANWLKNNMDPVFGWGNECRFSWGTAKELLEVKGAPCRVDWPEADDAEENDNMKLTGYFTGANDGDDDDHEKEDELGNWYGRRVTEEAF